MDWRKIKKLEFLFPAIQKDISLENYNSFRVKCRARFFFEAKKEKDLIEITTFAKKEKIPFFILGGGTNVLFLFKEYKGIIIKPNLKNISLTETSTKKEVKVKAGAGLLLSKLVAFSKEHNLSGLEWAIGIPGTIGGALYDNSGAFGKSIGDIVSLVKCFDLKKEKIIFLKNKECFFNYKDSIFKRNRNLIILSLEIRLKKDKKEKIEQEINRNLRYRIKNHPLKHPSAGSIFKNFLIKDLKNTSKIRNILEEFRSKKKEFLPTAYLIDKLGLKGFKSGGAEISEKHANFIINKGNAQGKDIEKLILMIRKKVKEKYGLDLEEEIIKIK